MDGKLHLSERKAWEDAIPKIPLGNAFASDDLFYCKAGAYLPLRSEEQYNRAKRIAEQYPQNFRILRYEGTGWVPCLYDVFTDVHATNYVLTGKEEDFPSREV